MDLPHSHSLEVRDAGRVPHAQVQNALSKSCDLSKARKLHAVCKLALRAHYVINDLTVKLLGGSNPDVALQVRPRCALPERRAVIGDVCQTGFGYPGSQDHGGPSAA